MFDVDKIINSNHKVLMVGSYPAIIQSILDFDHSIGRKSPSVVGIVASGRKFERYFFGKREMLIPVYNSVNKIPTEKREEITYFLNVVSGRRVLTSTIEVISDLPKLVGGVVFAENVPEKHALDLQEFALDKGVFVVGPASVGIMVPGIFKLGAIGGVEHKQLVEAHLFERGNIAVFSASGGTTNELINILAQNDKRISFALHFGGDRFPATAPLAAFEAAESDSATEAIVYFGELGGIDEYAVCEMVQEGKITKPVVAYIAGTVAEIFPSSPQFGHAKAMASHHRETARAKRDAMKTAGIKVGESFAEFVEMIKTLPSSAVIPDHDRGSSSSINTLDSRVRGNDKDAIIESMDDRKHALIASSLSKDEDGTVKILGEDLLLWSKDHSFGYIVASMFLGKKIKSREFEDFINFVLKLLVDHGPYVSGAVNTIVSARAGRDLVSSLSTGILTIGPRFGGAINQAAGNFIEGVESGQTPDEFVESFAASKKYISGIGHKKYRVDMPDPRVGEVVKFTDGLDAKYTKFARGVEKVTVAKKGNLILNIDGSIAAVCLDILSEKEDYSPDELRELVEIEFFNALFVASRSIGFISHFLDQKRLDEGLFRLPEDQVADASRE